MRFSRSLQVRQPAARWALLACAAILTLVQPAAAKDKPAKDEPPPPEDVRLETSDGLTLTATFYPSTEGKDAPAVILLHASGGNRADFDSLARNFRPPAAP